MNFKIRYRLTAEDKLAQKLGITIAELKELGRKARAEYETRPAKVKYRTKRQYPFEHIIICKHCGEEFSYEILSGLDWSRHKAKKYCTRSCANKAKPKKRGPNKGYAYKNPRKTRDIVQEIDTVETYYNSDSSIDNQIRMLTQAQPPSEWILWGVRYKDNTFSPYKRYWKMYHRGEKRYGKI